MGKTRYVDGTSQKVTYLGPGQDATWAKVRDSKGRVFQIDRNRLSRLRPPGTY